MYHDLKRVLLLAVIHFERYVYYKHIVGIAVLSLGFIFDIYITRHVNHISAV